MSGTGVGSPVDAARELAPLIRSHSDKIEANRELTREVFEGLGDAGLFHILVPRSLGGGEVDLPTYIQVLEEIGKADASTAWCVNQGAVFASYSAQFPPEVARTIWIDTPRAVVANSPFPNAKAVPVAGGFRVTGRQGFSTGCRHASWIAANGRVTEPGQAEPPRDAPWESHYFLLPVGEAEILDTWNVRGLRGTGTNHFAVKDVFVPAERALRPSTAPTYASGPLYRFPRTLMFASGDAAIALGVARRSLEEFFVLAQDKLAYRAVGTLRDQPAIQLDIGQAEANLRAGRALLTETVREVWEAVSTTGAITLPQRASLRLAGTHAIRLAVQVVDVVYNHAGTTALYKDSVLQRFFQDVHVISQHIQARQSNYELVGRFLLGLEGDLQRL